MENNNNVNLLDDLKINYNYDDIYLFASGSQTLLNIDKINFKENAGFCLFKKPDSKLVKYLSGRNIDYSFNRAHTIHLEKNGSLKVLNDEYNLSKCNFFVCYKTEETKNFIKNEMKNKNIDERRHFDLENLLIKDNFTIFKYIKRLGYIYKSKSKKYHPSIGFLGIIIMSILHPNAKLHLLGFEYMKHGKNSCHNYLWERTYLQDNLSNEVIYY